MSRELEQKLREKIEWVLNKRCSAVKRSQIMAQLERLSIINAIISLVGEIEKVEQDQIKQLQDENRQLKAKVNQLAFCNDSERDNKVIELFKKGLAKTEITKQTVVGHFEFSLEQLIKYRTYNLYPTFQKINTFSLPSSKCS
jgi:hypothetical protein